MPSNILTEHTELLQELKSYDIIKPYRLEGREKRYASTNSKVCTVREGNVTPLLDLLDYKHLAFKNRNNERLKPNLRTYEYSCHAGI